MEERVITALRQHGGPLTVANLAKKLNVPSEKRPEFESLLKRMHLRGALKFHAHKYAIRIGRLRCSMN